MKTKDRHTCPSCGNAFSGAMEVCPMCMLRKGFAGGVESSESSASEDTIKPTAEQVARRFEHNESLVRTDAADTLKRRLKQAGLPAHYSPHSFRATGITNFLENDGTLEAAQRIAGHTDSRTTKLYDRRGQKVLLEDMERIRY
jgi:hypothetical protein